MKRRRGVALAVTGLAALGAVGVLTIGRPLVDRVWDRLFFTAPPMVPADLDPGVTNVLYLHHSTGYDVWQGGVADRVAQRATASGQSIRVVERAFPHRPYSWDNNPFDFWNVWVDHSSENRERGQATLEDLAGAYDVIVWKNCFLAGDMVPDDGRPDVRSSVRTPANYRLQYRSLLEAMHQFPDTTFLVWTLPPKVATDTDAATAELARDFASWERTEWDVPGDNVHLWDYRAIAAPDDDTYLAAVYAKGDKDSHPNASLSALAAEAFAQRLIDVVSGRGDVTSAKGT